MAAPPQSAGGDREPLLSMRRVQKRFGSTYALKGVDLDLYPGEVLALIGENGAGKSTLMKVLSGAHTADSGRMTLAGAPYAPRNPLQARRRGVAMIYQELSHRAASVGDGKHPAGRRAGRRADDRLAQMRDRATARIGGGAAATISTPRPSPATLGIAEQQLVEIARSVALGCRVLVLDEPTSSLTRRDIDNLFAMLHRLRAQGLGIVYISHFLEEVREISDRFTVLRDGATVGGG